MKILKKQILVSVVAAAMLESGWLFIAHQPSDGPNLFTLCMVPFIAVSSAFSGIFGEVVFYSSIFLFLFAAAQIVQVIWAPRRTIDPNVPLFEVFVDGRKVGLLFQPQREEMFWCSYVVKPVFPGAETILRDESIWHQVKFSVKAKDGRTLSTFAGANYGAFCRGETNRMSFRSLWPIDT